MSGGSLVVVGTGIRTGIHLTPESRAAIESADELLYVASDALAADWLASLHPRAHSLNDLYRLDELRLSIYEAMIEAILAGVRAGSRVCAAFYGHPGAFVYPSHLAIERARSEGFEARMLPAVSAEDCLFADLGVDPAGSGCQSYEATDFLVRRRHVDPSAALVLWQVGLLGQPRHTPGELDRAALGILTEALLERYPADHEVTVYEASPYPVAEGLIERLPLARLAEASMSSASTLYVPPGEERPPDRELLARLS
jgi:uncharacterized protein YabN with tetrapyrrole methylase and pyrophosphatase domain